MTCTDVAPAKPTTRSRVTNGTCVLPGIDGRSASARRYRELCEQFAAELGGEAELSGPERAMVRQAAALTVRSEDLQAGIIRGEVVDDEALVRLTNAATRTLAALRRHKPAKPSGGGVRGYLARKAAGEAA